MYDIIKLIKLNVTELSYTKVRPTSPVGFSPVWYWQVFIGGSGAYEKTVNQKQKYSIRLFNLFNFLSVILLLQVVYVGERSRLMDRKRKTGIF